MIRFFFVKPKNAVTLGYIQEVLVRLNQTDNKLTCAVYDTEESEWKMRVDSQSGGTYFINWSLSTYDGVAQLMVFIEPQKIAGNFDSELHRIKVLVKDTLIKDWEKCVWLYDEQSTHFAEQLYGRMYRVENLLRSVISHIMITYIGIEWWEKVAPLQLKETYQKRVRGYKSLTADFKNVDDYLMAIDTDHLKDIMTHTKKEWRPSHDQEVESLLERDNQSDYGRIIALLKKQLKSKQNLWDSLFKRYFKEDFFEDAAQPQEDFLESWDEYCKFRNHIAHNKLLDNHAFQLIKSSVEKVEKLIQEAGKRFESSKVSDEEMREAHDLLAEFELEQRMYDAAGVKVYSEERVISLIQGALYKFSEQLVEDIDRSDLEVAIEDEPDLNDTFSPVCVINSKIDDIVITVQAKLEQISGEAGGTSSTLVQVVDNDENILDNCRIEWQNGDAEWSADAGYYISTLGESLQDDALFDLKDRIVDELDDHFTNYVAELNGARYSSIKDGGVYPICNDPCEECGELAVSLIESVLPIGQCGACGYEHEIQTCLRCECEFIGTSEFCESCEEHMAEE